MMRSRRIIVAGLLFVSLLYGCGLLDEHQRDWRRISNAATKYGRLDVIADIRTHLQKYPGCEHRAAAENYLVQSCEHSDYEYGRDFCSDYFETFPNGEMMAEVEGILWRRCEGPQHRCSDYVRRFPKGARIAEAEEFIWQECVEGRCESYISLFPNGRHIAAARSRVDAIKREGEKKRELESEQTEAIWRGPKIDASLILPPAANPSSLTVSVQGRDVRPSDSYSTYKIPAAFNTAEVCYSSAGHSMYSGSVKTCATMTLNAGLNPVPLSGLRVTAPETYDLICRIEGESLFVKGTLDTGLLLMPGRHALTCDLTGGQYADDASGSMITQSAHDVTATFESPVEGGYVDVYYVVDDGRVGALVRNSRY